MFDAKGVCIINCQGDDITRVGFKGGGAGQPLLGGIVLYSRRTSFPAAPCSPLGPVGPVSP